MRGLLDTSFETNEAHVRLHPKWGNMTFEKKYLKAGPDQISYVTNNLDQAIGVFRAAFGIPRFFRMERVELQKQQFQRKSAPMVINVAIAWTGTLFLEIIQPLTADAIYGHNLQKEEFALQPHHIAFAVHNWDDFLQEFTAEGKALAFSGEVTGMIHSGYWDARDTIGTYVEFYSNSPSGEAVWEQIRKGEF